MPGPTARRSVLTYRGYTPSLVLAGAVAVLTLASCGRDGAPPRGQPAGRMADCLAANAAERGLPTGRIAFMSDLAGFDHVDPPEVSVMNADGSGARRLPGTNAYTAAWSPDGTRLAFVRIPTRLAGEEEEAGEDEAEIYVINADGSGLTQLTSYPPSSTNPVWSPAGDRLAFESQGDIHVMNADGSGVTRLTRDQASGDQAWSPDGTRLAFVSSRGDNSDIYVMNADGTGVRRLTNHPARDFSPAWSPDGTRLAFLSERDDTLRALDRRLEIYFISADGSGLRNLTNDPGDDRGVAWSPDGSRIAFVRDGKDIYLVNADGSGLAQYGFDADDTDPAWSTDGRMLAFASNAPGYFDIYVMNADCSGLRNLTGDSDSNGLNYDDRFPVWLPASRQSAPPILDVAIASFGPRFAPLDSQLVPLLASLDSIRARLRRDSGTARADSAFVAFQRSFARLGPSWDGGFERWFQSDSAAYDSTERYFRARGLVLNASEGTFWLTEDPDFLLRRLGAFLTRPMRAYLETSAREAGGYESDGGLTISWDALADRAVRWEAFLEANPGFASWDSLWGEARGRYDRYLSAYVRGLENTPLILDEVLPSYERLLARHPETRTARFVRGLLDVLRRVGRSGGPEHEEYLRSTPWPAPGRRRPGSP